MRLSDVEGKMAVQIIAPRFDIILKFDEPELTFFATEPKVNIFVV